jgi:hypothetical protein
LLILLKNPGECAEALKSFVHLGENRFFDWEALPGRSQERSG